MLQNERIKCGLSRRQLSDLSGVKFRTIQDYENGQKDIMKASVGSLYKISKILNCPIEKLIK